MIKIIRKQGLGVYPVYQVDTTAELESLCGYAPVGAHIIKGELQYIINSLRQPFLIKRLINENGEETWIGLDRLYHLLNINYLCFEAAEADSTVQLTPYVEDIESDIPELSLEYSTDKIQWTEFIPGTTIITLSDVGDKVYLRGDNETFWHYLEEDEWIDNGYQFEMSGTIKASGSLMSIFDKYDNSRTIRTPFACYMLFCGCDSLITAPELPATILSEDCYEEMFSYCTNLTTAPELPAMTLTYSCYYNMFYGCDSLIKAPKLPATILTDYYCMFYGCASLVTAPKLPATMLAKDCYYDMFHDCTSLVVAPELPATTLAEDCYYCMFYGCASLVTAPKLPATMLAKDCYYDMFHDCTSLVVAPELPATTLAKGCYDYMLSGCTSLITAPELPATTLVDRCYSSMFYNCTSLIKAPELPATTLAEYCYEYMFAGCRALQNVKVSFTAFTPSNATSDWITANEADSTFTCPAALDISDRSSDTVPSEWTIVRV